MPRRSRLLTMFVLACALFLRVAVPAGWMPAPEHGAFAIQPCVAVAPSQAMEHEGKASHHDPRSKAQHSGDCSFAPLQAGFAAPTDAPALVTPAIVEKVVAQQAISRAFARGPPAPPPPARGPPALA